MLINKNAIFIRLSILLSLQEAIKNFYLTGILWNFKFIFLIQIFPIHNLKLKLFMIT